MRKSLVLGAIVALAMTPAMAEEVTLFAAGSLKAALSEVAKDYSTAYGVPVDTSFGPSGLVRERIEAGEAAHVFASANMRHPRTLESAGKGGTSTPKADPSGDYAFELFDKSGHAGTLKAKALQLTGGPDSTKPPEGRNNYAWVLDSDQADVLLTYCTNAVLAQKEVPGLQIIQVPEALSVGADYGLIVLDGAPADAWKFAMHILSPAGQSVLASYGFDAAALPKED